MLSEIHFPNWILSKSFASGFSTGLMRKDVKLAVALAKGVGVDLPIAKLAQGLWSEEASGVTNEEDFTRLGDPDLLKRQPEEAL
jgi:3-hydroxyisobutyrate dehydrogenase